MHLISEIDESTPQAIDYAIEIYRDEIKPNPPWEGFDWSTERVIVMYHGLEEQPAYSEMPLPDGRIAEVRNLNPGKNHWWPERFRCYANVYETAREALLAGKSQEEAIAAMRRALLAGTDPLIAILVAILRPAWLAREVKDLYEMLRERNLLGSRPMTEI